MELKRILGYLHDKAIFITGATGFLGMVLVEKILRVQPDVKKLYLLIRAPDAKSATQRMHDEIIGKELFRVLREKWGAEFNSFISEKVVAVPGDISFENLGVNEVSLMEKMCKETQIIVHSAATTDFDERYDLSLRVNVFGILHMLSFASKCLKLEMFLHISTAYICGERAGLILEDSSSMDDMAKINTNSFDIEVVENNLVKEKLNELKAQHASEEVTTSTLKDFGIERAKKYGWPNTYVFTKTMGEMMLCRHSKNNDFPYVIVRPPIVTSTYKEPFPGWVLGYRTVDSVIAGYCKGKLKCILLDPTTVGDMIPVDMVVNAMIAAIAVNANKYHGNIYHVGSSSRNPIKFTYIRNFAYQYFSRHPWVNKEGKPIIIRKKFTVFKTMSTFRMYMQIRYILPLKGLNMANKASGRCFQNLYDKYNGRLKLSMRMIELYRPYLLFKGIFDDANSQELQRITGNGFVEDENFDFDPTCIDWEDYIMHTHIPGFIKHVLGTN